MKFTVKQLFSIVDGRLSTEIGDVYEILNTVTGQELMTHHLPVAMSYIEKIRPDWFVRAGEQLEEIKEEVGDDFEKLMLYIDEVYSASYHEVTEMTKEQMKDFGRYMMDNSLLLQ